MTEERLQKGPHIPTEKRAVARLQLAKELHELGTVPGIALLCVPRYLVTYMNSQTRNNAMRSATVVSVTNQSDSTNLVRVTFYKGFQDDTSPVGTASYSIPPQFTVDFASRHLPLEVTCTNAVPDPQLTYDEGRAIVSSSRKEIGVSARVYYTAGEEDETLHAVTDSKVVVYGQGNSGD